MNPGRGDPTGLPPALTPDAQTRRIGKTPVFFGPPLARLTEGGKHTLPISGRLDRTAERDLERMGCHGLDLSEPERECIASVCGIGYRSPLGIRELPLEVRLSSFECEGLGQAALVAKLEPASFVDLLAVVEALGY